MGEYSWNNIRRGYFTAAQPSPAIFLRYFSTPFIEFPRYVFDRRRDMPGVERNARDITFEEPDVALSKLALPVFRKVFNVIPRTEFFLFSII